MLRASILRYVSWIISIIHETSLAQVSAVLAASTEQAKVCC
jgi:hypothetical protein